MSISDWLVSLYAENVEFWRYAWLEICPETLNLQSISVICEWLPGVVTATTSFEFSVQAANAAG